MAAVHPPFRADHIGSLKRPVELLKTRDAFEAGKVSQEELTKLEDKVIKEQVEQLREIGIKSVTDGEFRRFALDSPISKLVNVFVDTCSSTDFSTT